MYRPRGTCVCIVETHRLTPFNSCLTAAQRRLFSYSMTFSVFPLLFWMQHPIFYFWDKFAHLWHSAGPICDTIALWRAEFDTKCPMNIEFFKIKARFCHITVSLTDLQLFISERWELQNLSALIFIYYWSFLMHQAKKKYKLKNLQGLYVMKIKFSYKIR